MKNNLTVSLIITESLQIALKNIASIFGAYILWLLTIWIPYINVGTTIAIITLPIELSKGNIMSPTSIFDAKYRKFMGEFFILAGLINIALTIAAVFMVVPAIVIGIAWSLSFFLLLDKGMNPTEAISKSNQLTYGYKWTIFGGQVALALIPFVVILLGGWISGFVGKLISLIGIIFMGPIMLSSSAVIYKTLVGNTENEVE